jgi:hypothetical protein
MIRSVAALVPARCDGDHAIAVCASSTDHDGFCKSSTHPTMQAALTQSAPLNAIYVNAGATHPAANWLDALNDGGRLVFPLSGSGANRFGVSLLVTRLKDMFSAKAVGYCGFIDCVGATDPEEGAGVTAAFPCRRAVERAVSPSGRPSRRECGSDRQRLVAILVADSLRCAGATAIAASAASIVRKTTFCDDQHIAPDLARLGS